MFQTFPNHQPVIYDVHCGVHWVHIHFFWFPVTFQSSSSDFTCRGVAIAASTTCRSSLGRRLSAIPGWEKNANGPSYHWQWKMVHVEKNNSIWKDIQKRNYVKKKCLLGKGVFGAREPAATKGLQAKKHQICPKSEIKRILAGWMLQRNCSTQPTNPSIMWLISYAIRSSWYSNILIYICHCSLHQCNIMGIDNN